ncbi:MAG: DUF4230 domain-containing protein [Gemmataceae bacterium]
MTRHRLLSCVLLLGLSAGPAFAFLGPLDLIVPGLPSPGDVIKIIDALTKKDSATSVDVRFGATVSQGKLLIARTKVDVVIDRSSRNWRGQVTVNMVVPTEVSYSIDLQQIRADQIRLDPEARTLTVTMPVPTVEDVTPMLSAIRTENGYNHARFKFFDKHTTRDLQNGMLQHDYQVRARKVALQNLDRVNNQGRMALQRFLQQLMPGVKVLVN